MGNEETTSTRRSPSLIDDTLLPSHTYLKDEFRNPLKLDDNEKLGDEVTNIKTSRARNTNRRNISQKIQRRNTLISDWLSYVLHFVNGSREFQVRIRNVLMDGWRGREVKEGKKE